MRLGLAAFGFVTAMTWSLGARAQQPAAPLQPQPGTWGTPQQEPWAPAPQSATVQQLNAADNAGSFRRFEIVYLNADVAGAFVSTGTHNEEATGNQSGLALGIGAGVRFLTWTFGLRGRIAPMSAYTFMEGNLEAGFHLPLGAWDPYVAVHGGLVRVPMKQTIYPPASADLTFAYTPATPTGGDLGGSIGADYYFTALFSLGLDASLEALFLSSPASFSMPASNTPYLMATGESTTGLAFVGSLHLGFHFDL